MKTGIFEIDSQYHFREVTMNINDFKLYLQEHGCSFTSQRRRICEEISTIGGHFNAEELMAHFKKRGVSVSRATLYRTLVHLHKWGFLRRIDTDEALTRYECTTVSSHHEHIVCVTCGTIVEIKDPSLEELVAALLDSHGFGCDPHSTHIKAICLKCGSAQHEKEQKLTGKEGAK